MELVSAWHIEWPGSRILESEKERQGLSKGETKVELLLLQQSDGPTGGWFPTRFRETDVGCGKAVGIGPHSE